MASADTITKVVELQFSDGELLQGMKEITQIIAENKEKIEADKKALKDLEKQYKDGKVTLEEYIETKKRYSEYAIKQTTQNKALQGQLQAYQRELQNNIKAELSAKGSISQLRANVANLTKEWENLSKVEREGARGTELQQKILKMNTEINNASKSIGNFKDNVGNYEQSIISALGGTNKFTQAISQIGQKAISASGATGTLAATLGGVLIAALAVAAFETRAITSALNDYNQRLKETEVGQNAYKDATIEMRAAQAAEAAMIDKNIEKWAQYKGATDSFWDNFGRKAKRFAIDAIPYILGAQVFLGKDFKLSDTIYGSKEDYQQKLKELRPIYEQIQKGEKELQGMRREYWQQEARLNAEISEQRLITTDKINRTEQERSEALAKATAAINTKYNARLAILKKEQEIIDLEVKANNSSTEALDKQAQKIAEITNLETQRNNELRAIVRMENSLANKSNGPSYEELAATLEAETEKLMHETEKILDDELRSQWQKRIEDTKNKYLPQLLEAERLLYAGGDKSEYENTVLGIQLQQLEEVRRQLESLSTEQIDLLYGSEEAHAQALIKLLNQINNLRERQTKLTAAQTNEIKQETASTEQLAAGTRGLANAIGLVGQESETTRKIVAALAVVEATLVAYSAIQKAIDSSKSWIEAIVAVAAMVGTVVAAVSTFKTKTDADNVPKYAEGGLITGGSGTKDDVPIMAMGGEAVMTKQAVQDWGSLLSTMNVLSGGRPIVSDRVATTSGNNRKMMSQMFAEAMSQMPTPVVSVVDINNGQRKVQVMDRLAKL